MDDYSPLSSPAFSLGGSSVASSLSSPRAGTIRRIKSLFFKRERQVTLREVDRAIRRANKSNDAVKANYKELSEILLIWATQSADSRCRDLAAKIHDTLEPLWITDPACTQQVMDILAKVDILKGEEAQRNRLQEEYDAAEKLYYRGKWKGFPSVDLEPLERSSQILRVQADATDTRYRRANSRVLYLALHSLLVQCEETYHARQLACQNALDCLRDQNDEFSPVSAFKPQCYDVHSRYSTPPIDRDEGDGARCDGLDIDEGRVLQSGLPFMGAEYSTPFAN